LAGTHWRDRAAENWSYGRKGLPSRPSPLPFPAQQESGGGRQADYAAEQRLFDVNPVVAELGELMVATATYIFQ